MVLNILRLLLVFGGSVARGTLGACPSRDSNDVIGHRIHIPPSSPRSIHPIPLDTNMSYAQVAAHNAPPRSEQPRPDPALLNTEPPSHSNIADDMAKVSMVAPGFKDHPETVTSTSIPYESPPRPVSGGVPPFPGSSNNNSKAKRNLRDAEDEAAGLWNAAKRQLLRPGVAGGLLGVGTPPSFPSLCARAFLTCV